MSIISVVLKKTYGVFSITVINGNLIAKSRSSDDCKTRPTEEQLPPTGHVTNVVGTGYGICIIIVVEGSTLSVYKDL